jgi:ubiquinone/menaquinone biosynthesis C-methylase UbiE
VAGGLFDEASVPSAYQRYLVPPIFAPWAELLVEFAGVAKGDVVLDVASGTGVVAAAATAKVGTAGRVVAADVSPAMLALAARAHHQIETVESAADELNVGDGLFDVALCQQGFQFFPDRRAAGSAIRRALRTGGRAAIAVWQSGALIEPFDVYGRALESSGVAEPFPNAYSYRLSMSAGEVGEVLSAAGFEDVEVTEKILEIRWTSLEEAVLGIAGTPYGPAVAALDEQTQQQVAATLQARLRSTHPMTALMGRGVKR